jgi:hypothetical protein
MNVEKTCERALCKKGIDTEKKNDFETEVKMKYLV